MSYNPIFQRSWQATVASGFTQTVPDGITIAILNSTAVLVNGTVVLPVNPVDGQPLTLESPKGVTLLSLQPSPGQAISGPTITSASASVPIRLKYSGVNSTWYPN